MNQKNYLQITGLLFTVGALVHVLRLLMGWPMSVAGVEIPVIASGGIVLVAALLAYSAYKLMK